MDDTEQRLTELEIRFTHQAELLEELNQVVIASDRRIEQLERDNRRLQEMLKQLSPTPQASPDE